MRTNACALAAGEGKGSIRILHPSLGTMNHSCVANTRVFKRKNHVVCVRAQTPILKGEEVFLKYTSFFAGQIERSELIQDNWNFCCECARCIDPSDLGSNFAKGLTIRVSLNATSCSKLLCELNVASYIPPPQKIGEFSYIFEERPPIFYLQ